MTTIAVTDPTSARTVTLPDASGEFLLHNSGAISTTLTLPGADPTPGANALLFEGATDNEHELTLAVTDPTDDRTITAVAPPHVP